MNYKFLRCLGISAVLMLLCHSAMASGAIPAETLTYNRDLWMTSPQKNTELHTQINWQGLKSSNKNLTLWGQPILAVSLSGNDEVTSSLDYTIYDSTKLDPKESLKVWNSWKSQLSQLSGKRAKSLTTIKTSEGARQTRTIWDADDCTVLLASSKKGDHQTITVSFLNKDHAYDILSLSVSDVVANRTFYSNDLSGSFIGKLNGYDDINKVAKIQLKQNNQVKTMGMGLLSESDQAYIKRMAPYVAIHRGLSFKFQEVKSKPEERGQLSISEFNYEIVIRNSANIKLEDIDLNYHIYYYIGDVNKAGSVLARISGSAVQEMYPKMTGYLTTNKLELVKNVVKGRAGG